MVGHYVSADDSRELVYRTAYRLYLIPSRISVVALIRSNTMPEYRRPCLSVQPGLDQNVGVKAHAESMIVRNGQIEILAEPFQKLLVGCLVDPFAFFTEDIFTGAVAGSPELIKQLSAARGQGEVSAAVWMTALVLGIWDFIKTFTFPVPCAEELLAVDMNICFTDIVPVEGTQFASPHAGLDS